MSPREVKCIETLLAHVHRGLCEGFEPVTMHLHFNELYEVISSYKLYVFTKNWFYLEQFDATKCPMKSKGISPLGRKK